MVSWCLEISRVLYVYLYLSAPRHIFFWGGGGFKCHCALDYSEHNGIPLTETWMLLAPLIPSQAQPRILLEAPLPMGAMMYATALCFAVYASGPA